MQGQWALPGGFVDENESLDQAAARELQEETSVDPSRIFLEQVFPAELFARPRQNQSPTSVWL